MRRVQAGAAEGPLDPEKVAYWYFRLNGFFLIENFIVHPEGRGGQRTDADLLGVRFPFRAERLFDDPEDVMSDDVQRLALSADVIDVVVAEVKSGACALNGPWTDQDRQNVHRVLAAVGCLPHDRIEPASASIYSTGVYRSGSLRIRLVAVGRDRSGKIAAEYPEVAQLIWRDMLSFIWDRFQRHRQQKRQVDQWDPVGRRLQKLADHAGDTDAFFESMMLLMGVRNDDPAR